MKKTTLVILNYNESKTTVELIKNIVDFTCIENIVIVDNCSSDDSISVFERELKHNKVFVLQANYNGGYSYGNNIGCRYAIESLGAEYITVANPDIYFEEDVLVDMLCAISRESDIGMVGVKMNNIYGHKDPSAWKLPSYTQCLLENCYFITHLFGDKKLYCSDYFQKTNIVEVDVIAGSFFVISSKAYLDIGGFDEDTFLYYEENILAWKLKKKGYRNLLLCNKEYNHLHSVTIDKSVTMRRKLCLANEGRKIYLKKYKNITLFQEAILNLTFMVGTTNYILVKRMLR